MPKRKRKEYKNVARSKKSLADGLIRLLIKGYEFEDISVSQLCEEADINRGTFYNHYNDIRQIANEISVRTLDGLKDRLAKCDSSSYESFLAFFNDLNDFLKEYGNDIAGISRALPASFVYQIYNEISNTMMKSFASKFGNSEKFKEIQNELFIASQGVAATYSDLVVASPKMSFEECAESSVRIFDRILKDIEA